MCWYKPLLQPLASRFIAGEHAEDAIRYSKRLKQRHITPLFDVLGEHERGKSGALRASTEYMDLLDVLHDHHVQGGISLKLTAFGLEEDEETCLRAVSRIVRHAHALGFMVWIDMESSSYTTATLRVYKHLLHKHDNVGLCIQAYLKRAKRDILSLVPNKPKIRLVKGVYPEPSNVVYTTHTQITNHLKELITLCVEKKVWLAVGSHDPEIINHTLTFMGKNKQHIEFQMLKGVRDDEKRQLAEAGYEIVEYVPFGNKWEAYVVRRVLERWRNVVWMLQARVGIR